MSQDAPATKTEEPIIPPTSVVHNPPLPIEAFNNSGLRESVSKALEGVAAGHGHAWLNVDSHGAGLMLVERFNDRWALVVATRYSFKEGGQAQAALQVSW